jgi:capsular polysaccharide transport system permease protein
MSFLPLYLLSGVIFPATAFPPQVQAWLLWNPVLHLIEIGRSQFIPLHRPMDGVNLAYPAAVMLVTVALGLALYRLYRHQLISRD